MTESFLLRVHTYGQLASHRWLKNPCQDVKLPVQMSGKRIVQSHIFAMYENNLKGRKTHVGLPYLYLYQHICVKPI